MAPVNLTQGAITKMCSDNFSLVVEFKPVLQVIELELVKSRRYRLSLSDGSHYHYGFVAKEMEEMEELVQSGRLQKGSAVKLTDFIVNPIGDRRILVIIDLDVILDKCELVGEPVPLPKKCNCTTNCGWAFCGSSKLIPPASAVHSNSSNCGNNSERHNWSELEEETLLTILEEMVVAGNKGENGTFKSGTHEEVCKRMKNKLPGIVINVKHVVNKMKKWSTKLNDVVDMMNTNGFGWDNRRKCVTCDSSQVLFEYLEKHPKVGNHVNKEFKEFERLQGIFGKDRANGRRAESPTNAVKDEIGDNQAAKYDNDWLQHDNSPPSIENTSVRIEHASNGPPPKRPCLAQFATRFLESFDNKMDLVATYFGKIVAKLPYPSKGELVEEVKKLGLTEEEEIDLVIKFAHNQQYEKFFWEFQGPQRISFARKIIRM